MRQTEECADCGTAASAAVELQGFEIHEEEQVYSAVGATSLQCARMPKAKGLDQSAVAHKGLDWSQPPVSRPLNSGPH